MVVLVVPSIRTPWSLDETRVIILDCCVLVVHIQLITNAVVVRLSSKLQRFLCISHTSSLTKLF